MRKTFVVVVLTIMGVGFILASSFWGYHIFWLKCNGQRVEGVVKERQIKDYSDGKQLDVQICFTVPDTICVFTNFSEYETGYLVGRKVELFYNKSDPHDFIVNDNGKIYFPVLFIFFGCIILVIAYVASQTHFVEDE